MALLSLVASHHNRDLNTLEQLSVGAERLGSTVLGSTVTGAVVLPTCNRFEVYLDVADPAQARAEVVAALSSMTALDIDAINASLVAYEGDDAVEHLMSVSAGLESMVVGEREISGQVRRAHIDARESGHLSPALDRLFQSALRTARVVASSTGLGTSGRSVMSVAFDLADPTVAWRGASALVVGTGALAETGIGVLRGRGARLAGVYSPSGRAEDFAERHNIPVVTPESLVAALEEADVVLACSGGESIVLTPTLVAQAMSERSHPLTLIDLALHRDVATGVELLRDVHVVRLEDVKSHAPEESMAALESARAIVAHAVARFSTGESGRSVDPAIVALREHVFGLLEREVARARPLPGDDEAAYAQAAATEAALRHFAKALLHTPTVRAKELAESGQTAEYLSALSILYGLDVAVPDDACPAQEIDSSDD
ncbi:glutamyl-tRNA reductase [Demequina sp. TTPB684]|uniref:glutamyl-tRNA reductase n=1 Tax=unclassified Demequina TaxID=2620311 RepID=UPI001CF3BB1C|nr:MULTISPECIES: glutamyl-tRNA reductase [unclassified Demequina]MCB2412528.1 glutamyl-tRNA reductase [Demequina sp. TTPB684]UPU87349.1 glutamyl-tRNA reductase [Demequina sp. TMPB413]